MCVMQHTLQHGQQHIVWSWLDIPNIVQVQMSHVNVRVQKLGYDCVGPPHYSELAVKRART